MTEQITVRDIVMTFLVEHNYNGLCNSEQECGCGVADFPACWDGCHPDDCEAAHQEKCTDKDSDFYGEDWYVPGPKPRKQKRGRK